MAEIPPPPDKLPEGFSLSSEESPLVALKQHYHELRHLMTEITEAHTQLVEQRRQYLEDLRAFRRLLGSVPRIITLSMLGAIGGMLLYHSLMVVLAMLIGDG